MASQREYESVVWYFLQEKLKNTSTPELYEYFYSSTNRPHTAHGHERFVKAIKRVQAQMGKFEGEERP